MRSAASCSQYSHIMFVVYGDWLECATCVSTNLCRSKYASHSRSQIFRQSNVDESLLRDRKTPSIESNLTEIHYDTLNWLFEWISESIWVLFQKPSVRNFGFRKPGHAVITHRCVNICSPHGFGSTIDISVLTLNQWRSAIVWFCTRSIRTYLLKALFVVDRFLLSQ